MRRRDFLSLFSLLFARPTAALVPPVTPSSYRIDPDPPDPRSMVDFVLPQNTLGMGDFLPTRFQVPQLFTGTFSMPVSTETARVELKRIGAMSLIPSGRERIGRRNVVQEIRMKVYAE